MLDEATDFFQRFLQAEYEMAAAAYSEPDSALYAKKLEAYEALLENVRTPHSRVRGVDDLELGILGEDWFETGKDILKGLKPSTLFQVKHYAHPELGDLFRAYVSHPAAYLAKDYGINFYAARVDGELRIVSQYVTCDECSMSGRVNGRPCSECKGTGWRYMDGRRLETLGPLVQVAKLQPPSAPEHRKEYDAE